MTTTQKTSLRQNLQNTDRKWYVIDAADQTLGKVAELAALKISGRNRVDYTPHTDGGDYVVVINVEKIAVSGNKEIDKKYYRHSRYLGNLKTESLGEIRQKNPRRILQAAVSGMLPKNRLRAPQLKRLFMVVGAEHGHEAQKPEILTLN